MTALLETRDLNRSFGAVTAAVDVNVSMDEGEIIGVIGANGAGKTSFVNMVTGYLKPSSGSIHFLGEDITADTPREMTRRGIVRSFQIPQLFPELTALDNLLVALGIASAESGAGYWRHMQRPQAMATARELLERYGVAGYTGNRAASLPQGVRKLLDIAMATIGEPKLVMLDEPTSGVSIDEKFDIMDRLMAAMGEHSVTVLFVEHDMEIVERYARRVLAFYEGRIIADGVVAEVLNDTDVQQYVVGRELHRQRGNGDG